MTIPSPDNLYPLPDIARTVQLRPLVKNPQIVVGEYTYYDDPFHAEEFERRNVLYNFGEEKLVIGRYCALAEGVRFIMSGGNHRTDGVSTFPFTIFGGVWGEKTLDIALGAASRGDTVVGNDVWIGYQALIMPGVRIGNGAIIASGSVVVSDVPAYGVVGGNPAKLLKKRYSDEEIELLERIAWWDWPVEKVTEHVRVIMAGTPAELAEVAG
ncbi:MAG: virginiamycin acetyltransferase [Pseudonocardiales bacterium]|jgi:virginiamycin A acetyltransferase|nr:virginiamycin acetyltransferase [Pseudonocardiales bacterium]